MAQQVTTSSTRYSLSLNDFWKGLLIAVGSPVITILIQSLNEGSLTFNWKAIATTGLSAGLMYLAKNFFDSGKIVITNAPESTIQAVKDGDATAEIVKK